MPRRATELLSSRHHPQRQALTEEMHVRQFPSFAAPARVLQLVVLSGEPQAEAARRHALALCRNLGVAAPQPGKYLNVRLPGFDFFWEQHSEFAICRFIKSGPFADPFAVSLLKELGNYRNMALLGLPVAQRLTPTLTQLEKRLAALSREISTGASRDEELMHLISHLSAEPASLTADTSYRMSASRAYAQIVSDRLLDLRIGRVPGFQTLPDFTERRLTPAMRTCASFWRRSEAAIWNHGVRLP